MRHLQRAALGAFFLAVWAASGAAGGAQSQGSFRVIVELNVAVQADAALTSADRVLQRQAITAVQDRVIAALPLATYRLPRRFTTIPFIALEVTAGGLAILPLLPEVLAVSEDRLEAPSLAQSVPLVQGTDAWAAGYDGAGWAVAILDTGVDGSHAFLSGKVIAEACYSAGGNCPNGATAQVGAGAGQPCSYATSDCRHGTHVAGIAAGQGASFSGVAKGADVVAVQVFSRFTGTSCGGAATCALSYVSDQIFGLEYVYGLAGAVPIASVNMSLGGSPYTTQAACDAANAARKGAIDNLRSIGVATVASSGNGSSSSGISAPACISSAISVGSTTKTDGISSFSNSASFLSLLAPGSSINSSIPGGGFAFFNGTSMASPHVAGAWAIGKQVQPVASVSTLLAAFRTSNTWITDARNGVSVPRLEIATAIGTIASSPPSAFSKAVPANGVAGLSTGPTLGWTDSGGSAGYEYCIDTSNNNVCNAAWIPTGTNTFVGLTGLGSLTTYFWQVRAINPLGTVYANGSSTAFWSFATAGVASPPFGQMDTPAQNATGVQGAVGVTGWSLDDVGVSNVQIFRNCLGFEPGNCQSVLGNSVVYIGDAAFLDGARPDVAAAFPAYPNNTRAGWGYLMLTPMLPHVPNSQPFGGQGTLTLYAIATDTAGNKTLLGRTFAPGPGFTTPTTFSMTNDTIAKPFGAIDTPGQGQTISGIYNNFGWAITPDLNTVPDGTDILIPTNGSTMTVYIDSLPVSIVAYNQCRGTVGNPPPGGVFCNDDVANIFGNPTPVLTPNALRASNPTKFRNLDAARGAIGAYTFNTNLLSNGLHTIAWSVTDSAGRNEGIGSRFFLVQNGAPLTGVAASEDALRSAPAQVVGTADSLAVNLPATDGVWGRTGYNLSAPWAAMHAGDAASFAVRLPELSRMELWLGTDVDAGYLVAEGKLHPLPVGSSLTGPQFAWMPPPGYTGTYELAFIRGGERITVKVTVVERPKAVDGERQIRMALAAEAHSAGQVKVTGAAADPQAAIGAGIDAVHVWATRSNAAPVFLGAATLDRDHFSLMAKLAPGTYTLTAYAWNQRTESWEDSRSVTVTVGGR